MSKWKKKLSSPQRKHLKECGLTTLKSVKESVHFQESNEFPCWDCVGIGSRLGIKTDLKAFHARA